MSPITPPAPASAEDPGRASLRIGPLHLVEIEGLDISDMALEPMQDGSVTATVRRLAVRGVHGRTAGGSLVVTNAVLTGVVARLSSSASNRPPELIELSVEEIRVEGVDAVVDELPQARPQRGADLRLEALDDLDGLLRAFITDALWFVDAEIVVPLTDGWIDFNRVDVEHIGPNSSLAIGPHGVHVDAAHGGRIELLRFDDRRISPASLEAPSHSGDRGRVAVRALVEAIAQAPADEPVARVADPNLQGPMQRTRLSGELRLGDGALGSATHHVVLTGRGDDKNRVDVSSPAIGRHIHLRIPRLAASSASFGVAGKSLRTLTIDATLEARVIGSDGKGAERAYFRAIELALTNATLRDVRIAPPEPTGTTR